LSSSYLRLLCLTVSVSHHPSAPENHPLSLHDALPISREASGHLLVTGFGLLGDGVHRISPDGSTVTKVTAGFTGDVWSDLAVEASGSILAVGSRFGVGPGVYRIDAATGSVAALSAGAPWVPPRSDNGRE